jgi:hypothetical protein
MVALSPLASARRVVLPSSTRKFSSRHYRIATDVGPSMAKLIAAHMDLVYADYQARFRAFPKRSAARQPLYVFAKRNDYMRFLAAAGIDGSGSGGMFFITQRAAGLATYAEGQSYTDFYHALYHEGFHQIASQRIGPGLPAWANEGMAEYFGEAIIVNGKLKTGLMPPDKLHIVQAMIRAKKHLPLSRLLTMDSLQWNARLRAGVASGLYQQSWSVVHFLVNANPRYQKAFIDRYLLAIAKGAERTDAYRSAFGNGTEKFEQAWQKYMLALQPSPIKIAETQLDFLSRGQASLWRRGRKPKTIERLHQNLKAESFQVQMRSGHTVVTLSANQDALFSAPQPAEGGRPTSLTMIKAKVPGAPRTIVVRGLNVTVASAWVKTDSGHMANRFLYTRSTKR